VGASHSFTWYWDIAGDLEGCPQSSSLSQGDKLPKIQSAVLWARSRRILTAEAFLYDRQRQRAFGGVLSFSIFVRFRERCLGINNNCLIWRLSLRGRGTLTPTNRMARWKHMSLPAFALTGEQGEARDRRPTAWLQEQMWTIVVSTHTSSHHAKGILMSPGDSSDTGQLCIRRMRMGDQACRGQRRVDTRWYREGTPWE